MRSVPSLLPLIVLIAAVPTRAASLDDVVAAARRSHGEPGERAARFLVEHLPPGDRDALPTEFLVENLELAFQARKEFPWAATVPEELFLNDVLPYAVFDEPRDPWRAEFLPLAREIVRDARTATEAAQALNQRFFQRINVHYHTGRKRPNQSARESIASGRATCTGLSIILVEACRAVGIPARAVGTPLWTNLRGNHTWVEVWDGDWHFTGADEYDASGLNRGWFVGDAAKARADDPRHAIYATSWKREGLSFPLVWARNATGVAAVNVTHRYARPDPNLTATGTNSICAPRAALGVRLFDRSGGTRLVARVAAVGADGRTLAEARTKAGTADLNDLARLDLPPDTAGTLRFDVDGVTRQRPFGPVPAGDSTLDAVWSELAPVP